ncbi:hypothetical protein [Streptomyces sp. NPDC005262]|uniref:hypothetical protein n=1 Tax=Streptomyces sp. NPDC005262 TaxID=3364710 RepID=UPI00367DDCBB
MGTAGTTPPEPPRQRDIASLGEVACRYQPDEIRPEDLPMIAAETLAAGLDTPTLCELAGLPRNSDARDAFCPTGGVDADTGFIKKGTVFYNTIVGESGTGASRRLALPVAAPLNVRGKR